MTKFFSSSKLEILKKFSFGLAFLLAVGQISHLHHIVVRDSSHWGVIVAEDTDSAHGIEVLEHTKLLNDNGWYSYGPLYYRIAYVLKHLDPITYTEKYEKLRSLKERSWHLALLQTSFLALIALILVFVGLVGGSLFERALSICVFLAILFLNRSWPEFVFRAKPELVHTLFVALGTVMTVRTLQNDPQILIKSSRKWPTSLWLACLFWGLALASKHLALIFMPGLLLLWIPPLNKESLKSAAKFFLAIFGFYLLTAYPNSLKLGIHFKKLSTGDIAATHRMGDFTSFLMYLKGTLPTFYLLPLALVSLYVLFISFSPTAAQSRAPRTQNQFKSWRYILIPLFPFLYLGSRIFLVPTNQYHLPIMASSIILVLIVARPAIQEWAGKRRNKAPLLFPLGSAAILILLAGLRPVPKAIAKLYTHRSACRDEIETVIDKINRAVKSDKRVAMDGYVPFSTDVTQGEYGKNGKSGQRWGITIQNLEDTDYFVTKKSFYSRFIDPTMHDYVMIDHKENWKELRSFYATLNEGKDFKDLSGKTWSRTYQDKCDYEVWERR